MWREEAMKTIGAVLAAATSVMLAASLAYTPAASATAEDAGVGAVQVAMTVSYPWDGVTPETVTVSTMPGCVAGDAVVTDSDPDVLIGDDHVWVFSGTKTVTCAEGTFTLSYVSHRIGDALSAFGTWRIISGTGRYEYMSGRGVVRAHYTYDTLGQRNGIIDTYFGWVRNV
jgi:hypothetical protein